MILHNERQNPGEWKKYSCMNDKMNIEQVIVQIYINLPLHLGFTQGCICFLQLQLILNECAQKSTKTILHSCSSS